MPKEKEVKKKEPEVKSTINRKQVIDKIKEFASDCAELEACVDQIPKLKGFPDSLGDGDGFIKQKKEFLASRFDYKVMTLLEEHFKVPTNIEEKE